MVKTRPWSLVKLLKLLIKTLRKPWILTSRTSKTTNKPTKSEMPADKAIIKDDIDKEFMPHLWSTRFENPEEVLQHHIQFITTESEKATNAIPHVLDVKYGSSNCETLDIFGTDLPDDAPILAYIHGGFWKQMSKDVSRFPAIRLHASGIKTIVIGYDRHHTVTLRNIIDQVEKAVCYVLKYAEEKHSRGVYIAGHCAGAHLVATVLSNSELFECHPIKRLNGVFFISGIYDLRQFCQTAANDTLNLTKIDAISSSPLLNTYTHLEHSKIRFYVMAAHEDSPTFKRQSRDFYQLLHDICPLNNMYFEVKGKMDHFNIVECFAKQNNYLKNLILHDICKHS